MRFLNKIGVAFLFVFGSTIAFAQDIHFAQMEYAPLVLNPALAGANSALQGSVNYRTQWSAVATPYKTMAAAIDGRLNTSKKNRNGHLVGGLSAYNDQSGDAKVTSNSISIALGYHLILDPTSTLGIAIYTGFGQHGIDNNVGRWGSQYDGMAYVSSLPSGEQQSAAQFSYLDAGAGIVYTYKDRASTMRSNNGKSFNYGFAMYHLNRPNYSFYNASGEQLYMRFTAFGNGMIGIGDSKWIFNPGIYYQRQKTAQELLLGAYFKYQLSDASHVTAMNKSAYFSVGLFYRTKDALVTKMMIEWSDYSLGFAYDVNISRLVQVSNARGGAEFFLRYAMTGQKKWIR